jgi:hypothetical protein
MSDINILKWIKCQYFIELSCRIADQKEDQQDASPGQTDINP